MKLVYGQTYSIDSSHLSCEDVTPWSDGTFSIKSEYFNDFDRASLQEIEESDRVGAHIAHMIRLFLITTKHDSCDYPWTPHPHFPDIFIRCGRCPTCGEW